MFVSYFVILSVNNSYGGCDKLMMKPAVYVRTRIILFFFQVYALYSIQIMSENDDRVSFSSSRPTVRRRNAKMSYHLRADIRVFCIEKRGRQKGSVCYRFGLSRLVFNYLLHASAFTSPRKKF